MRNCTHCHSEVPEGAQFCPDCGTKQAADGLTCIHCEGLNPIDADFCIHCGEDIENSTGGDLSLEYYSNYKPKYPLDFRESVRLPVQLRTYFLKSLKERLIKEGNEQYFDEYVNRFLESPFLKTFDQSAIEMTEQSYLLQADQSADSAWQVDRYLTQEFERLMNNFVITEGAKIHDISPITEELTGYEESTFPTTETANLILDSLNLSEESEKWYHDLSAMPKLKLQNAKDFFLFTEPEETIFLICDQTIFGSCREGFALTEKALYWKAHFNKAQQVNYKEIESLELSEEWLVINGQFFNANPAINVKMIHLLKKLKGL